MTQLDGLFLIENTNKQKKMVFIKIKLNKTMTKQRVRTINFHYIY